MAVTTIVASAYDTSGNGGRRIVQLSNGWQVAAVIASGKDIYFEKSDDGGNTWSQLAYVTLASGTTTLAIASYGTTVYCIMANTANNSFFRSYRFDATTVSNASALPFVGSFDSTQSGWGKVSLDVDSTGALYAEWISKNSTYPNAYNVRYSKSTDGGTTWGAVRQQTNASAATDGYSDPCIITKSNDLPMMFYIFKLGSNYYVQGSRGTSDGTSFYAAVTPYSGDAYAQYNPCGMSKRYGSNIGRMWLAWDGLDATDTTKLNVRVAYSDDGGANWSVDTKITTGNTTDRQKPTLAEYTNGDVYVFYQDGAGISYQKCANGTTAFSGVTSFAASGTNPSAVLHTTTSSIGVIYMDASVVKYNALNLFAPLSALVLPEPNNERAKTNIDYLRQRANDFRSANNVATKVWTDPTIVAGVTPIKALHWNEIQQAIDEVYTALGTAYANTATQTTVKEIVQAQDAGRYPLSELKNRMLQLLKALQNQ